MTKEQEALKLALEALEKLIDIFADVSAYEDDEYGFTDELVFIPDIKKGIKAIAAIKEALAQPEQEAIYGMNPDDWKDVVAAIAKVRDGRGIYLACRPADVFQVWFLALGTAKLKEKNNG